MTRGYKLSEKELYLVTQQTVDLIAGLRHLRDALGECTHKHRSKLSCAEIEDNLGRATEHLSQLDDGDGSNRRYGALKRGMIDFAQPLIKLANDGNSAAIRKKNAMLALLECEVAGTFMPLRLLLALRLPFSESTIVVLEALRSIQNELLEQGDRRYFDHDVFSYQSMSQWLHDIPSHTRKHLWRRQRSAIETLFLFSHRNNAKRAADACSKWQAYCEPERSPNRNGHSLGGGFHSFISI